MHHRIDRTLRFAFALIAFLFLYILYAGTKYVPAQSAKPQMGLTKIITNSLSDNPAKPPAKGYYARLSGFNREGGYLNPVGDTQFREIALTFDIGNLSAGEYILNVLREEGVKATIFLANNRAIKSSEKSRAGNHSS